MSQCPSENNPPDCYHGYCQRSGKCVAREACAPASPQPAAQPSRCGLTECQGKPMCSPCAAGLRGPQYGPAAQPEPSVCARCGGLVADPVIVQPAAQGELTDERIIDIKKASRCADPTKQWGDTLVFARAVIAAHDAARAPEIMEAVKLALSNKLSIHEVERLVRGEKA